MALTSLTTIKNEIVYKPTASGVCTAYASDRGCDWRAAHYDIAYAVASGTVIHAKWTTGWGMYLVISHGSWCSAYAHLDKSKGFLVKVGDTVRAGQPVGKCDSTGPSTGHHLHLDIYRSGKFDQGARYKSPFGIRDLFKGKPTPTGKVGGDDGWGDGGDDLSAEDMAIYQQGLDFTQTVETLVSSDNWKWMNDLEDEDRNKNNGEDNRILDKARESYERAAQKLSQSNATSVSELIAQYIGDAYENVTERRYKPTGKGIIEGSKKGADLLQFPSLVEAPLVNIDFNGYVIGTLGNTGDAYPNYITSIDVNKMNGKIHQYTIQLTYGIRLGDDPNLIDELLSSVGYTKPIKILYGDASNPSMLYKEESAFITEVKMNENVGSSSINYTINAISASANLLASQHVYPTRVDKPSNIIKEVIRTDKAIKESFPLMTEAFISQNHLIPSDDMTIKISGMQDVDAITYINYLTSCMQSMTGDKTYAVNYCGDYFSIDVISKDGSNDFYEIDIGYPSSIVMDFAIKENTYWPAVYEYNASIPGQWNYSINNSGDVIKRQELNLTKNKRFNVTTMTDAQWWKQVTEYPITAGLTIKGLVKPIILGSYIKINTLFYGEVDLASGLYFVVGQKDTLTSSGYRTTLELLRVGDTGQIYG